MNHFAWLAHKQITFLAHESLAFYMDHFACTQLFINLANEKLQRQFNANTFALEEKVYHSEDIGYVDVGV